MSTTVDKDTGGRSGSGMELCRDRTFQTRHVTVPIVHQLSAPVGSVSVDYARQQDIAICKQFIQEAADRGDNVGTDEYDETRYSLLFGLSEIFIIRTTENSGRDIDGGIQAFIAIQPCLYARGLDNCLASLYVFRSPNIITDVSAYRSLVHIGVELTSLIDIGYTNCVVSTTLSNLQQLQALQAEGFNINVIVPRSINLARVGLRENVIMSCRLPLRDRPPRSADEVINSWNQFAKANLSESIEPLPSYDFLPRDYVFTCGLRCVCRNVTEDDVSTMYDMMCETAQQGEGYALHEHPTLDYFRRMMLGENPCIVYEDNLTHQIVAYSILCDSWMSRTKIDGIGESDTLVNSRYRSMGIGTEIVHLESGIMKQTGRIFGINDTMISNERMLNICRRGNVLFLGTIPRSACRLAADGSWQWEDVVIDYYKFDQNPTFTEICDDNAAKHAAAAASITDQSNKSKL